MDREDLEHLKFIYERLVEVHGENPSVDCMLRFRKILKQIDSEPLHHARELREGEVMMEYIEFDRHADRSWTDAEYLLKFGMAISAATVVTSFIDDQTRDTLHRSLSGLRGRLAK
jgi:hypothetical protein